MKTFLIELNEGAAVDVAASGLTFCFFTAAGALAGGGGMLFNGKELSKIRINHMPMGGFSMTAGPSKNPQFPFVLLDRVLVYFREISEHAHGKRDGYPASSLIPQSVTSSTFPREEVKKLTNLFSSLFSPSLNHREAAERGLTEVLVSSIINAKQGLNSGTVLNQLSVTHSWAIFSKTLLFPRCSRHQFNCLFKAFWVLEIRYPSIKAPADRWDFRINAK